MADLSIGSVFAGHRLAQVAAMDTQPREDSKLTSCLRCLGSRPSRLGPRVVSRAAFSADAS